MELMITLLGMAIFGLSVKIFAVHRLRSHWAGSRLNKLAAAFLVISFIQTCIEISGFMYVHRGDVSSGALVLLKLYYVSLAGTSMLLPFVALSVTERIIPRKAVVSSAAVFVVFSITMLFTPWIVAGAKLLPQAITRVPGPAYPVFIALFLVSLFTAALFASKGRRVAQTKFLRVRSSNIAVGLYSVLVSVAGIIALMAIGVDITGAGVVSVIFGMFTLILGESMRQDRIIDLITARISVANKSSYALRQKSSIEIKSFVSADRKQPRQWPQELLRNLEYAKDLDPSQPSLESTEIRSMVIHAKVIRYLSSRTT